MKDNGDIIFKQLDDIMVKFNDSFMADYTNKNECIFLNALEESDLNFMYGKLEEVLHICYKTKGSESIQEIDIGKTLKVAEYLSDLIPVIN